MMKPKIRFKGFEGEWKASIIGDFCSVSIGEFVIKTKQNDNAPYPVYNGGSSYTGFYENYNQEGPKVIVSARGANAGFVNYCKKNFWAGNSCYSIATKDNRNLKFLYHCLKKNQSTYLNNQQAANIPSISKKDIQETILMMPKSFEQQAIASYFTSLDSQISASTSRLASLKQMKAASLQAMFPQEGETVPKIRFQNNRWQKYKVGDLCDLLTGYPFPGDKILTKGKDLLMRGINITEGSIRHSNEIDRYYNEDTIGLEKYRLQVGDLVIGMDGSKVGKNSALVTSKEKNSLLVQRVARLRNEDKNLIKLIQIAVGSDNFIKYVEEMKTSSAIPHISPADIRNFPLSLPEDSNERRLIASYFTSLDRQISLQSQRLEKLKQIKSACLDKMFV